MGNFHKKLHGFGEFHRYLLFFACFCRVFRVFHRVFRSLSNAFPHPKTCIFRADFVRKMAKKGSFSCENGAVFGQKRGPPCGSNGFGGQGGRFVPGRNRAGQRPDSGLVFVLCQSLGKVQGMAVPELVNLLAAAEAIGHDDFVGPGGSHSGQQSGLGDGL